MQISQTTHRKWINNLIISDSDHRIKRQRELQVTGQGNTRQDETRPVLEGLMSEGYNEVTWDASKSMHGVCRELHNQKWTLDEFMSGLEHDAPMFEKTHPGDTNCLLVVTGPEVEPVTVDSYGTIEPV